MLTINMRPPGGKPSGIQAGRAVFVSPKGESMPIAADAVSALEAAGWTRVEAPAEGVLPPLIMPPPVSPRSEESAP